jgi:uncharacterized membrane protein (DUF4010 family)
MEQSEIFLRILLTVVFGAILGLETETREIETKGKYKAIKEEKSRIGGLRTYTILSLIGGIAGLLFNAEELILVYITFIGIIGLIISAYIQNVQLKQAFGMTTEIAIMITFLLGFLTTSNLVPIAVNIFILVILAFFLSQKRGVGNFIDKIQHNEIIDVLKFGLISAVILPLLPNHVYYVHDAIDALNMQINTENIPTDLLNISLINPFKIWFVVVVISGISLGGYVLSKMIGSKKSLLLTSIMGGLISSTSTTVSLAHKSKTQDNKQLERSFAGGAIIANAVSFISIITLLSILSSKLLEKTYLVLISMFSIGLITGLYLIISSSNKKTKTQTLDLKYEPFSVSPALKFVSIILLITIGVQLLELINVKPILIIVTALTGVLGFDPATIALSELVQSSQVAVNTGVIILLLANIINFISKIFISYKLGSRVYFKTVLIGLVITALGNIALILN